MAMRNPPERRLEPSSRGADLAWDSLADFMGVIEGVWLGAAFAFVSLKAKNFEAKLRGKRGAEWKLEAPASFWPKDKGEVPPEMN